MTMTMIMIMIMMMDALVTYWSPVRRHKITSPGPNPRGLGFLGIGGGLWGGGDPATTTGPIGDSRQGKGWGLGKYKEIWGGLVGIGVDGPIPSVERLATWDGGGDPLAFGGWLHLEPNAQDHHDDEGDE